MTTTCDAYTCVPITDRTTWQAHKNDAKSQSECSTGCWPDGKWVCYGDGTTPPVRVTSQAQWTTLRAALPPTATIVDDPTTCELPPSLKKWYCTGATPGAGFTPWDCGQITTWDQYNKYKNFATNDTNCDKCFPSGKFWCDPSSDYACNSVTTRAQYLAHKDALLDSCDSCFPPNLFYCNNKASCAQVESYSQYKNAPRPFYKTSDCGGNCGGAKRGLLWLWILLAVLLVAAIIVGIYIYARNKKRHGGRGSPFN